MVKYNNRRQHLHYTRLLGTEFDTIFLRFKTIYNLFSSKTNLPNLY